jgi:hypothetical protein
LLSFAITDSSNTTLATLTETLDVFNGANTAATVSLSSDQLTQVAAPMTPAIIEGDHFLTLQFVSQTGVSGHYVYYKKLSDSAYAKSILYTSSPASLTDLSNATTYALYVTAVVGGLESAASAIEYATPNQLTTIGITTVAITNYSVSVSGSTNLHIGAQATFNATYGSVTPSAYQWYVDGNAKSGATAATWNWTPTTTDYGAHVVSLVVTVNGVKYAGSLSVSVGN